MKEAASAPALAKPVPPVPGPTIATAPSSQGPNSVTTDTLRVHLPAWAAPVRRRKTATRGRRARTRRMDRRGRYIRARLPRGRVRDVAWDATLRAAAVHQRRRAPGPTLWRLTPDDLREKERSASGAHLILFVVDASWSMAVSGRMEATKGALLTLLEEAYRRRDRVGLIVFRREGAQLVLPPTRSIQQARRVLSRVPVGGKTPLAAGLALAFQVIQREKTKDPALQPLVVLLTDGAGNVPLHGGNPLQEAYTWARKLRALGASALVVNMEQPEFDRGLAQKLATYLQAPCLTPLEWTPEYLAAQVRRQMQKA